jgi:hypothetical protein
VQAPGSWTKGPVRQQPWQTIRASQKARRPENNSHPTASKLGNISIITSDHLIKHHTQRQQNTPLPVPPRPHAASANQSIKSSALFLLAPGPPSRRPHVHVALPPACHLRTPYPPSFSPHTRCQLHGRQPCLSNSTPQSFTSSVGVHVGPSSEKLRADNSPRPFQS